MKIAINFKTGKIKVITVDDEDIQHVKKIISNAILRNQILEIESSDGEIILVKTDNINAVDLKPNNINIPIVSNEINENNETSLLIDDISEEKLEESKNDTSITI